MSQKWRGGCSITLATSNKLGSIVNQSSAGLTILCYPELNLLFRRYFSWSSLLWVNYSCVSTFLFLSIVSDWIGCEEVCVPGKKKEYFSTLHLILFFLSFFRVVERTQGDEVIKDPSFFDPEHWEQGTTCRYKYRNTVTEIQKYNDSMLEALNLKK